MTRPKLELYWHHRRPEVDRPRAEALAAAAVAPCLAAPGPHAGDRPLAGLRTVEVSFVDDGTIAQLHADHLADPAPTDVITFPHGEVFISLDTAATAGPEHGLAPTEETVLYLVHALLHLNGHHDAEPAERETMHRVQEEILGRILGRKGP